METPLKWHSLPSSKLQGVPVLLVSIQTGKADYVVRLTDLANLWVERLDRRAICSRAWDENTCIDPSDTPENMLKFLATLQSALESSDPARDRVRLVLSLSSGGDADDAAFVLHLTCGLAELQPLKWPFHLKRAPPSDLAADFVFPMIQSLYDKGRQVESLLQILGHKDAVVAKLVDKLEITGSGLEGVFATLSGKKKTTRATAETKIKGLAPFDREIWESEPVEGSIGPSNVRSLTKAVFGPESLRCQPSIAIERSSSLDRWWRSLKSPLELLGDRCHASPLISEPTSPSRSTQSVGKDDTFQVQLEPPHPLSAEKQDLSGLFRSDDQSTADEDEYSPSASDQLSTRAATKETQVAKAKPVFGVIGGQKHKSANDISSPRQLSSSAMIESPREGSETASECSEEHLSPSHSAPLQTTKKVGFTGEVEKAIPVTEYEVFDKNFSQGSEFKVLSHEPVVSPTRKRFGVVSKKIEAPCPSLSEAAQVSTGEEAREPSAQHNPRETSRERADRKREELKEELRRKTAAGPARKKRRF